MLKKVSITIALVCVLFFSILIIRKIKIYNYQRKIIKKEKIKRGVKYDISNNIRRFLSDGKNICQSDKFQNGFKLIYEMNFECSKCFIKLKSIYDFYVELSKKFELNFYIVSSENSESYIRYHLDEILVNYDLFFIEQEPLNYGTDLYLLDEKNSIVFSGDIFEYPFLKKEYIKRLKFRREK